MEMQQKVVQEQQVDQEVFPAIAHLPRRPLCLGAGTPSHGAE